MTPDWNERRCFDCSDDLGARRFAVLKQMREFPTDDTLEPWEVGMVRSMCFDPVFVCADCAGWYGDEAIDVSEDVTAADEPLDAQRHEAMIDSADPAVIPPARQER